MEEYCPYCDGYTHYSLEYAIAHKGWIHCSECGKKIHACQACTRKDCHTKARNCFQYKPEDVEVPEI